MELIKNFLQETDGFKAMYESLQEGNVLLSTVTSSLVSHLLCTLKSMNTKPLLVITRNEHDGRLLYDNLTLIKDVCVNPFLLDEFVSSNILSASNELRFERLQTLEGLATMQNQIIITNVGAIRRYLTPKANLQSASVTLQAGLVYEPTKLVEKAIQLGYKRVSTVVNVGEFGVRGGIIDIFPKEGEHPLRIEFFDDEIETIRFFDVTTQRSIAKIKQAQLTLLYEFYYEEALATAFEEATRPLLEKHLANLTAAQKAVLLTEVNKDIARINSYADLDLTHKYLQVMYETPATLLDYLDDPQVVWVAADKLAIHTQVSDDETQIWYETKTASGELLAGFLMQEAFNFNLTAKQLFLSSETVRLAPVKFVKQLDFASKGVIEFRGNLELFVDECLKLIARDMTVVIVSDRANLRINVLNKLTQAGVLVATVDPKQAVFKPLAVNVVCGYLDSGFELASEQFVVYTDTEMQQEVSKRRVAYRGRIRDGVKIQDYNELQLGDIVVHLQHGIGRYVGVEMLDMLGVKRDVLRLEYRDGDFVYVPIDKIDLVQKYVGSEGANPRLSRLGGVDWSRAKKAATKIVKDIANELIQVYARRKYLPGFAFSKDSTLQQEFEAACEFVETPDQLKTATEIKLDMEKAHPMDRLLVGDVGYGKTEVAMRVAMKAVVDNKQVVYVTPTTILARQQYENFKKRFADYAVEIRLLNRHVTDRNLELILRDVASGKVDILIGTHRVLSKDIRFCDLGLLVVDEEQRFGVEHKETIKQLKSDIDVLTLTATPIPRTMQMSMIGIRSMSMIETPPKDRYPVQTYVLEAHDSVIRDAINRELARGGQVFYLHNRVTSLPAHVNKIKKLVPEARIGYAHGKMSREALEDTMQDFEDQKFDVLVCTTIIETGIDIPNANTLIVGDAYRLGLSQMYQLRGRVGRSDRIAYAYFLYPQNYILTENSEKRLETIREFTALGSGFKIAMRDLAIRGAGDMLGTRQNGFLDTVGLDLYTKMLAEAIKAHVDGKENVLSTTTDLTTQMLADSARELDIGIGIDRYIPDEYIDDSALKIEMYKKMKSLLNDEQYHGLKLEFKDRFGTMPEGVENLVDLMYLKNLISPVAEGTKVTKTTLEFILKSEISATLDVKLLYQLASEVGKFVRILFKDAQFQLIFDLPTSHGTAITAAIKLFAKLNDCQKVATLPS